MPITTATNAMGTRFEFVVDDDGAPPGSASHRSLSDAVRAAIDEVERWHAALNRFDPASLVSFINREAFARPVRVEPDLAEVLALCARVQRDSDGAFDVCATAGPAPTDAGATREPRQPRSDLVVDPTAQRSRVMPGTQLTGGTPVPSDTQRPRFDVDVSACTIRLLDSAASLDLGAVAKGFALDLAARPLREAGVTRALIHGGTSSVLAIGAPPGKAGWRIALGEERDARAPVVVLRDCALSVSRAAARARRDVGQADGRLIDPRTGAPVDVERSPALVAVIGERGALAECWSTALAVLGQSPAQVPPEVVTIIAPTPGSRGGTEPWRIEGDRARRWIEAR